MIDTREELLHALTEAAELEHGLLCQYLFAAFSMKIVPSDGDITWAQAELVREWEATILLVARQEMAHLGTVCNLLTAIGGAPHFGRRNFPQTSLFPSPVSNDYVSFTLEPFSESTVERFVVFETPEDQQIRHRQSSTIDQPKYETIGDLYLDYSTVGDLYGQIQEGFENIEEIELFIGPRRAQDTDDWSANLRLLNVVDRASAVAAIDSIVEEGEGTLHGGAESHYERFTQTLEELRREMERCPDFKPARPVVCNPSTQRHRDSEGASTIICNPAAKTLTCEVAELFNAVYGTMILMLMQFYAFADETEEQRLGLMATIRQSMSGVIRPLGELLTEMPVSPEHPGKTAGPGFELYTDLRLPNHTRNAWIIFHERLLTEAQECGRLSCLKEAPPRLAYLYQNLARLATNIERLMKVRGW